MKRVLPGLVATEVQAARGSRPVPYRGAGGFTAVLSLLHLGRCLWPQQSVGRYSTGPVRVGATTTKLTTPRDSLRATSGWSVTAMRTRPGAASPGCSSGLQTERTACTCRLLYVLLTMGSGHSGSTKGSCAMPEARARRQLLVIGGTQPESRPSGGSGREASASAGRIDSSVTLATASSRR